MKGTFKTTLQVTIPFEVALWLRDKAKEEDLSINDIVRLILDKAMEGEPKQHP